MKKFTFAVLTSMIGASLIGCGPSPQPEVFQPQVQQPQVQQSQVQQPQQVIVKSDGMGAGTAALLGAAGGYLLGKNSNKSTYIAPTVSPAPTFSPTIVPTNNSLAAVPQSPTSPTYVPNYKPTAPTTAPTPPHVVVAAAKPVQAQSYRPTSNRSKK